MENRILIKRLVLAGLPLLLLLGFFVTRGSFLNGRLSVDVSDSQATIYIEPESKTELKKVGTGKVNIGLAPGKYLIQAQKGESISLTTVQIEKTHTTEVSITLQSIQSSSVALSGQVAQSVFPGGTDGAITYLNSSFNILLQSNGVSRPNPYQPQLYPIRKVNKLADGSLIVRSDSNGLVWVSPAGIISNTGLNLIDQVFNYDVSQNGSLLYISNKDLVLRKSPLDPNTATLLKLESVNYQPSISPDGKYASVFSGIQGVDSSAKNSSKPANYIVDTSTPNGEYKFSTPVINGSRWSPGDILVYSIGSKLFFLDPRNKTIAQILTGDHSSPVWILGFIDNDTLIYSQGSALWRLDIKTKVSSKLNDFEGSIKPDSLGIDSKNKIYYYSTDADNKSSGGNIYKVNF